MPICVLSQISPTVFDNLFTSATSPPAFPLSPLTTPFTDALKIFPSFKSSTLTIPSLIWCPSAAKLPSFVTKVNVPTPPTSSLSARPSLYCPSILSFAHETFSKTRRLLCKNSILTFDDFNSESKVLSIYIDLTFLPSTLKSTSPFEMIDFFKGETSPFCVCTLPLSTTIKPSLFMLMPIGLPPIRT